jgi:hypothetical protein
MLGHRARRRRSAAEVGELTLRNPGIAELLTDLEADDDLRARFEIELLHNSAR